MTQSISIQGQTFVMHPSGALYWLEQQLLLISDVHLGKVMHFRKHGVAVPMHPIAKNFLQLDAAVDYFRPESIVFLGDLFHSKKNAEWEMFADWVSQTDARIILVAGNHDIIDQKHYEDLGIAVGNEWLIGVFLLTHHPEEREGFFNFSGHLHPGIELRGSGRQSLKLPCFFRKPNQMILPAFGTFTGRYYLVPTEHDCVFAIANAEVVVVC
ncbi:ligase-associated DNA damage response endonuclease PdeM [Flavobacterium sp.]|uniref:ligase-associated DNA damage response endonuclease PdeM n=1 Tax=Flavobacterium sp. TaxID=239 RepID=UPI0039E4358F